MSSIRDFEYAGWQAKAASYDAFSGATRLFAPALLNAAEVGAGMRVLDVCCGTGIVSAEAAARGAEVVGVDFSAAMIDRAKVACAEALFQEADAEQLPFADASFDAVVANFGLHHGGHPVRALAEARRVLRAGGRLAFTLWAEREVNTAWRLMSEAVVAHGREVSMPGKNADGAFEDFSALAVAAGFDAMDIASTGIERNWQLPADADLVAIFESGTVRMAALLAGQTSEALAKIRAHVAATVRAYHEGGCIVLPTRAYLISARVPATR